MKVFTKRGETITKPDTSQYGLQLKKIDNITNFIGTLDIKSKFLLGVHTGRPPRNFLQEITC